jgi:hypothetical protein
MKDGGLEHIDHGKYAVAVTEVWVHSDSDIEFGSVRTFDVQFMLAEMNSQLRLARVALVRVEMIEVVELASLA